MPSRIGIKWLLTYNPKYKKLPWWIRCGVRGVILWVLLIIWGESWHSLRSTPKSVVRDEADLACRYLDVRSGDPAWTRQRRLWVDTRCLNCRSNVEPRHSETGCNHQYSNRPLNLSAGGSGTGWRRVTLVDRTVWAMPCSWGKSADKMIQSFDLVYSRASLQWSTREQPHCLNSHPLPSCCANS